jgi:FkbM family methyltransferase
MSEVVTLGSYRFAVRPGKSDTNSAAACFNGDEYGLDRFILTDRLVFDIGAHVGGVSVKAASKGARVVAVEPVPENAALIRETVAMNDLPITVLEGAVGCNTVSYGWTGEGLWGALTGEVHSFVGNTGHGLPREGYTPEHTVEVEEFTLGYLVEEYGLPYLLKLDCEGGEWAVLAEPIIADIPVIVGEYHPWAGNPTGVTEEFTDNHEHLLALLDLSHRVVFPDDLPSDTTSHFEAYKRAGGSPPDSR